MLNFRVPLVKVSTVKSTKRGNNTPEKYTGVTKHNHSARKLLFSNNSGSDKTYDSQDLLLLEIKLLKKENNFLKKKINDLKKENQELLLQGFGLNVSPKKPYPKKGSPKDNRDTVQISVDYFFKQINTFILSVADVFELSLDPQQQIEYLAKHNKIIHNKQLKSPILTKQTIHRKLQKILLDSQEKRYKQLLDLFTDYYKIKTQANKQTAYYIDSLTEQIIQLNRWMLDKLQSNKRKKKSQTTQCYQQNIIHVSQRVLINQFSEPNIHNPTMNEGFEINQINKR